MLRTVPDILARIVERKQQELLESRTAQAELDRRAETALEGRRDFRAALRARSPAVIAEFKKASPSKGVFAAGADPAALAAAYERGGAAALSVLTDADHFLGSLDDLSAARAATGLPALRKDFTISERHVVEAAAWGADAILLIAAILSPRQLRDWLELAARYRMAALVEVHDEDEVSAAVDSGADLIGVNNRDLRTFQVTLETSLRLAGRMPPHAIRVAESGIRGPSDVRLLEAAGYHAFLVGEHLMLAADPAQALRELAA